MIFGISAKKDVDRSPQQKKMYIPPTPYCKGYNYWGGGGKLIELPNYFFVMDLHRWHQ